MIRKITGLITAALILFVMYFYYEVYLVNVSILIANIVTVVGIAATIELLSRARTSSTRISNEDKLSVLAVIMTFSLALSFVSVSTVLAV